MKSASGEALFAGGSPLGGPQKVSRSAQAVNGRIYCFQRDGSQWAAPVAFGMPANSVGLAVSLLKDALVPKLLCAATWPA